MDGISVFIENLFSMARMLGQNSAGAQIIFLSGALAAASGYPAAGENYFLLTPDTEEKEIDEALCFFKARGLSFVAPLLPKTEKTANLLEAKGITHRLDYTAMSLALTPFKSTPGESGSVLAKTEEAISEWGETVWQGFDETDAIDSGYAALARYIAAQPQNALYTLRDGAGAVACGLLHGSANGCGLYYFATKPTFRRKGYARKLMRGMVREAAVAHSALVLLATPAGLPFYRDFGFAALADIPIFSDTAEI